MPRYSYNNIVIIIVTNIIMYEFLSALFIRYQENSTLEKSHRENPHQSNSSLVIFPRNIPTQKFPTWNNPTYVFKYSNPGFSICCFFIIVIVIIILLLLSLMLLKRLLCSSIF